MSDESIDYKLMIYCHRSLPYTTCSIQLGATLPVHHQISSVSCRVGRRMCKLEKEWPSRDLRSQKSHSYLDVLQSIKGVNDSTRYHRRKCNSTVSNNKKCKASKAIMLWARGEAKLRKERKLRQTYLRNWCACHSPHCLRLRHEASSHTAACLF